eukprot:CAMPEP_0114576854 /NCGR_PEP_ID=MMETSP0125-20121206/1569_1 /TAXON_ID=485358 ORGANISM="Aristerostoma sp., Strain ATCC 50986" /NCGR_SAMPLE_ID=MMETSP0125 /ASSEMBLY_ACC=CAM_ASM_000245 /LENGTH=119 /DNA_ID=CAMNT_0001765691 /DNA_START=1436 /DNA_END=1795 /DNA_ORIENTATION=+
MDEVLDLILESSIADDTGFCFGDFTGEELADADYGCSSFPVKSNDEFFLSGYGIPSDVLAPLCPTVFTPGDSSLVTFCSAYANCGSAPTVGLAMSASFLACMGSNPAILAATGGLSASF